jgi:anaerobic selenocysteine-containing dehydrogenase
MQVATAGGAERQVRTMCRLCLNRCGIVATIRNGKVIRIDGDAANPYNQGKACAKGRAGFYTIDSPYRVTRPLRRTNPRKGPGIDPGWETISWENALEAAKRKGMKNGDWVEVETDSGKKAQGRLKLTHAIHPEVASVWASAGRWANSATQGKGPLGIHFNSLLTLDDEHLDFVSAAIDSCLRVKISKLESGR